MSQRAKYLLDLIQEAKAKQSKRLDLSNERLSQIPPRVFELKYLKYLNLSGNELTSLPDCIGELQNLTTLNLRDNKLTSLPDSIRQLQNLTTLYLIDNKLTSLPDCIYELNSLQVLRLENYSPTEGAGNQIKEISPKVLQLTNLRKLDLADNPIENPPPEVVAKGIRAIKNYFRQLELEGEDYIYEAKLLIVGEAGAGKTSLAKKIQNPTYQLKRAEASTEGIEVIKWQFPMVNGKPFRVNIWDFGGQEIYHATHQFFLTKRSLYALVCDGRKEDTDFYYWLNVVELLSDKSPLLIIKNEKQDRKPDIPENQLRGRFSILQKTLATNLATNRGLEQIFKELQYYIQDLPHIGSALPKTWVKVRHKLEADERNYISLEDYLRLCKQHGFSTHKDALQLADYLHDLGVILHFQDNKRSLLYRTVILKPEWATSAVYRVLDNPVVKSKLGHFAEEGLAKIWHEAHYAHMQGELLELMLKFKLCYQLPNREEYIAPQLLSNNQPTYSWPKEQTLHLRHQYKFMPKGLMTRFIVATHDLIADQRYVWKSGVILRQGQAFAEVIEEYEQRQIKIRVTGPYKKELLTVIMREFKKIHDSFQRLDYQDLIPCNCASCQEAQTPYFYSLETLRDFAQDGDPIQCYTSRKMVDPRRLILNIMASKAQRQPERTTPTLAQLRQTLKQYYDDPALDALCLDHFTPVYEKFARGLQTDEKINLLLHHCRTQPEGLEILSDLITQYQKATKL